jgi:hypothetical protein
MFADLKELMRTTMLEVVNPRVALIIADDGEVHFTTTLPPGEAAAMIQTMVDRVRRYGGNYVRDHIDRAQSSRWN